MGKIEKSFIDLKLSRVDSGVSLYIKSKAIERFFKQHNGENRLESPMEGDVYGYAFSSSNPLVRRWGGVEWNSWGINDLMYDERYNLSFFRAVGLEEGVTFNLIGVFPLDILKAWHETTSKIVTEFYTELIKPVDFHIEITVTQTY